MSPTLKYHRSTVIGCNIETLNVASQSSRGKSVCARAFESSQIKLNIGASSISKNSDSNISSNNMVTRYNSSFIYLNRFRAYLIKKAEVEQDLVLMWFYL